ncbi:hypothetical protein LIA77_09757 [Sarocladium implicatum]|nr:hypothetical protein LIA77_09757 [Sarocladium implicatum]
MDPNTTRYLHAKFLVHCAPQGAIDCITYRWEDARVLERVMSLCEGDSQKYLSVLESTRQDVAKLAAIFNPALNPSTPESAFASAGAFAQNHQLKTPSSIQSPVPSLSRLTDTSTPSLSRSRVAEHSSGWVFGNGPEFNPEICSIGKSNSPYRFVRADFLARFGPPHTTIACEILNTYVEPIGLISSSEYVRLTWQRRGRNRTHAEKFWIVENQEICDIMTANEPSPLSPGKDISHIVTSYSGSLNRERLLQYRIRNQSSRGHLIHLFNQDRHSDLHHTMALSSKQAIQHSLLKCHRLPWYVNQACPQSMYIH